MERVRFIDHKGKKILLIDFSNCSVGEIIKTIVEAERLIASQPFNSVLTLTNVAGGKHNRQLIKELKKYTAHNKPYVKRGAVIGLEGLQMVIYNAVMAFSRRNLPLFNDIEKAKDWLVQD